MNKMDRLIRAVTTVGITVSLGAIIFLRGSSAQQQAKQQEVDLAREKFQTNAALPVSPALYFSISIFVIFINVCI